MCGVQGRGVQAQHSTERLVNDDLSSTISRSAHEKLATMEESAPTPTVCCRTAGLRESISDRGPVHRRTGYLGDVE
jgi:hypothetical protein